MGVKKTNTEVTVENIKEEAKKVEKNNVEVEIPAENNSNVEVDTTPVDDTKQATAKTVRIKMRENHSFWVNTDYYNLKKGQCYNVPISVKRRLNKVGLLLPL